MEFFLVLLLIVKKRRLEEVFKSLFTFLKGGIENTKATI